MQEIIAHRTSDKPSDSSRKLVSYQKYTLRLCQLFVENKKVFLTQRHLVPHRILSWRKSQKYTTKFSIMAKTPYLNIFTLVHQFSFQPSDKTRTRVYSPAYILATPTPIIHNIDTVETPEDLATHKESSSLLFCCYGLTQDQRWLLASCTNETGMIMETFVTLVEPFG